MADFTKQFEKLVELYVGTPIEYPVLRDITIAQWILESGYGHSRLAQDHFNFGGLKYRPEMKGVASAVSYAAHDGIDKYCNFESLKKFIEGYWRFIDRTPYKGWRDQAPLGGEAYIRYVGARYTPTQLYADNVIRLLPVARALVGRLQEGGVEVIPPGTSEPFAKPLIKAFIPSPNFNTRNGAQIRRIVLHYTTSRNVDGTIDWFKRPASRVSAHYVISREGDIYQMVQDSDAAWHARSANAESIGIEHSAAPGDELAPKQEAASIALLRWLVSTYKVNWNDVDGHRFTPGNIGGTNCPDHLFGDATPEALRAWIDTKARVP